MSTGISQDTRASHIRRCTTGDWSPGGRTQPTKSDAGAPVRSRLCNQPCSSVLNRWVCRQLPISYGTFGIPNLAPPSCGAFSVTGRCATMRAGLLTAFPERAISLCEGHPSRQAHPHPVVLSHRQVRCSLLPSCKFMSAAPDSAAVSLRLLHSGLHALDVMPRKNS